MVSSAAQRNKEPIHGVLRPYLKRGVQILETGSGSGTHAIHMCSKHRRIIWQPSNPDHIHNDELTTTIADSRLKNVLPPVLLDVEQDPWPVTEVDLVVSINMLHISAWTATLGLFAGADRVLTADGHLFIYGPFTIGGMHSSEADRAFDQYLQEQNSEWGIKSLEDVLTAAAELGFCVTDQMRMPANNFSMIFGRKAS